MQNNSRSAPYRRPRRIVVLWWVEAMALCLIALVAAVVQALRDKPFEL